MKQIKNIKELEEGKECYFKAIDIDTDEPPAFLGTKSNDSKAWDITYFKGYYSPSKFTKNRKIEVDGHKFIDFSFDGKFRKIDNTSCVFGLVGWFTKKTKLFILTEKEFFDEAGKFAVVENL